MKFESFQSLPLPSKKKEEREREKKENYEQSKIHSPSQSVFLLLEIVECKCVEQLLLILWEKNSGSCLILKFFVSVLIVAGIGIAVSPAKGT